MSKDESRISKGPLMLLGGAVITAVHLFTGFPLQFIEGEDAKKAVSFGLFVLVMGLGFGAARESLRNN